MKQALSRLHLCHISCRAPPSHVWLVRNMVSQCVAMEEIEANESSEHKIRRWQFDETKVLIAAKRQHDLENLQALVAQLEGDGVKSKKAQSIWKKIETFCRERGVQRSSVQCKCRWRRIMLTYSQIKSWEENRGPELASYWSMNTDEMKANGFIMFNLDKPTYNLLDELYDGRGDAIRDDVRDDVKEDVVKMVAESGSSEHLQPGQGMNPSLKVESEIEGDPYGNSLSVSVQESCESHRASSHFLSRESGPKQTEWIAGSTASVEEGDTANSHLSSIGPGFPQEMQNGQVGGAAYPVEKMLGDQVHSEQVMNTAVSVRETHEGFGEGSAFIEVNASNEHLSGQVTETAVSLPIVEKAGGTDPSTSSIDDLETGDATNVNDLSVPVEGTQEQQSWQVAGSVASSEETHQSMNAGTQFSYTGMPIQVRHNGKVAGFIASPDKAPERLRARSHFVPTEVEVFDEMRSEHVSGSTSASSEETYQSQNTSTQFPSRRGKGLGEWQTGKVAEWASFPEEAHEEQRASGSFVSQGVEALSEMQSHQVADNEISKSPSVMETPQSQNTSTQLSTAGVEVHHERPTGQVAGFASLQEASSEGQRPSSHLSLAGVKVFDGMQSEQVAGSEVSMSTYEAASLEEKHQSQNASTSSQYSPSGEDVLHEWQTEQVTVVTSTQEACESHRTSSNLVSSGVKVFTGIQSKQVADGEISKSTSVPVSTIPGVEGRTTGNFLPSQECQGVDATLVPNSHTSETVSVKGSEYGNDEGSSNQQTIFEGNRTKTFERPASEVKVDPVGDDKGSPTTSEKGSVEGQALQPYHGGKTDDIVMYVPAAIGNVIRSVSQTLKKLFKG